MGTTRFFASCVLGASLAWLCACDGDRAETGSDLNSGTSPDAAGAGHDDAAANPSEDAAAPVAPTDDAGVNAPADAALAGEEADADADAASENAASDDAGEPRVDAAREDAADAGPPASGDAGPPPPADAGAGAPTDATTMVPPAPPDARVPDGDAPVLVRAGYFVDALGPRIVVEGHDPNGDIASLTLDFYRNGSPVAVDYDGNGPKSAFTAALTPSPGAAGFSLRLEPTSELTAAVDELFVTASDGVGHTSATLRAPLGMAPISAGACDLSGFTRCADGSVCAEGGAEGAFSCRVSAVARQTACASAARLDPAAGITSVRGSPSVSSLWHAPTGCLQTPGQGEAVVKLRLATPAARVVLSTDHPHTTFDSVLYLLDRCTDEPSDCVDASCTCSDWPLMSGGTPTSERAELVLTNLAATAPDTEYLIVVESFAMARPTDTFELTVTLE